MVRSKLGGTKLGGGYGLCWVVRSKLGGTKLGGGDGARRVATGR